MATKPEVVLAKDDNCRESIRFSIDYACIKYVKLDLELIFCHVSRRRYNYFRFLHHPEIIYLSTPRIVYYNVGGNTIQGL